MNVVEVPLVLSRHAFGPREVARAGHLWRLCQDAAIGGSAALGWQPARYRELGGAFIVRWMGVVHHREVVFGEPVEASTWVSSFKRGMISERQVRLRASGQALASASQRWVYVAMPDLAPTRAPEPLLERFVPGMPAGESGVTMPPVFEEESMIEHLFQVQVWHGWMDPLAHANHPAYVDWADEALHRILGEQGLDPQRLEAVAEEVTYRSGAVAPETLTVRTRRLGRSLGGAVVFRHLVEGADGRAVAEVVTHRRLAGDVDRSWTTP